MRNGSITLSLLIGVGVAGLAVGGGLGWHFTGKARDTAHAAAGQPCPHLGRTVKG